MIQVNSVDGVLIGLDIAGNFMIAFKVYAKNVNSYAVVPDFIMFTTALH